MDIEVTMLAFSNVISHQIHKASFLKFLFIHWAVHTNQYRPFQVCIAGQYAQYNIDNVPVKDLALWLKKWWRAGRFLKAFQEPVFTPHQKINRLLCRPWKLKIKDIKKLSGLEPGSLISSPVYSLWCHFLFMEEARGESSRRIWDPGLGVISHIPQCINLPHWSLESRFYWQEQVSLFEKW